MDGHQKPREQV